MAKKAAHAADAIKAQTERVSIAQAKYDALFSKWGAEKAETKSAYNELLEEKTSLAELKAEQYTDLFEEVAKRYDTNLEDSKCVPATGIGVNWAGPLTIAAGGELKGEIVLTPAGANTMKDFRMEFTGDSIVASTSGTALIVRAKSPGSATITVTHIGGAVYTCTINVI